MVKSHWLKTMKSEKLALKNQNAWKSKRKIPFISQ